MEFVELVVLCGSYYLKVSEGCCVYLFAEVCGDSLVLW